MQAEAKMADTPDPAEKTMDLHEALGLIGPRVLDAPAGGSVRDRWALATTQIEDGVTVEWRTDGRILATHGTVVGVEFDAEGALAGDVLGRWLQAVLRGPDWRLELPAFRIQIRVG